MPIHAVDSYSAVPDGVDGRPLLVAYDQPSYDLYLKWLADYLYRPYQHAAQLPALTLDQAWPEISAIESEIASWIWDHPFETYPPGLRESEPRHVDFPHRAEISRVLSRVPSEAHRLTLLDRFFQELAIDAAK